MPSLLYVVVVIDPPWPTDRRHKMAAEVPEKVRR